MFIPSPHCRQASHLNKTRISPAWAHSGAIPACSDQCEEGTKGLTPRPCSLPLLPYPGTASFTFPLLSASLLKWDIQSCFLFSLPLECKCDFKPFVIQSHKPMKRFPLSVAALPTWQQVLHREKGTWPVAGAEGRGPAARSEHCDFEAPGRMAGASWGSVWDKGITESSGSSETGDRCGQKTALL